MKALGTIGTFIAGAAVGFVACGTLTVRGVLNSDRHRKALAKVVSEKLGDELFEERSNRYRVEYVPYTNRYRKSRVSYREMNEEREPIDIVFRSGMEAETALNQISQLIEEYGMVTVADVADLCELESNYNDGKYGWVITTDMNIDGLTLHLPSPRPLK